MPYLWEGVPAFVPCWHIHHGVLLEWSTEPLEERAEYIRVVKSASESVSEVETRLRLMRPVKGKLPEKVVESARTFLEAREAETQATRAFSSACANRSALYGNLQQANITVQLTHMALRAACANHADAINALHRAECPDCPWDGTTIFPEGSVE